MVLPFAAAGWLKDLLQTAGLTLETCYHGEGHTLGPSVVVQAIVQFVVACLAKSKSS